MRKPFRTAVALAVGATLAVAFIGWGPDGARAATGNQFLIATGAGPGGGPHVKVFTATGAVEKASFFAYDPAFRGGVSVALGDIDNNNDLELVTGAGPGGSPHVRVFSDRGAPVAGWEFFAYDAEFRGGVNVAVSDVDGNGDAEIITAAGAGGGPHIKVWDIVGNVPQMKSEFFAFDPTFRGGIDIAGAWVDESDNQGIVAGAGPGGGPHVKTFNAANQQVGSWFAYDQAYRGGVSVSTVFEDDDDVEEIVTGALAGRGHVRTFTVTGVAAGVSFYAFDAAVTEGVDLASIDGDLDGPFVVAPAGAGKGVCSVDLSPPNCSRQDYFQGRDFDGGMTTQAAPYVGFFGGVRVAGGFGFFDDTVPTTTTATPTTTTTVPTTTTSSTTTSTSTTTTTSTTTSSTTSTTTT